MINDEKKQMKERKISVERKEKKRKEKKRKEKKRKKEKNKSKEKEKRHLVIISIDFRIRSFLSKNKLIGLRVEKQSENRNDNDIERKFTSGGKISFDGKVYTAAIVVGSSHSCKGITKIGSVQFGLSV